MAADFRRSLSLPCDDDDDASRPRHARSSSVPFPSHPAISHLHHLISVLRFWPSGERAPGERVAAVLLDVARLHAALDDLLHLPLARDPLRRPSASAWADRILDDFLRLADAHGSFRTAVLALEQLHSEVRSSIRRRDAGRLASALRAHRRVEKDLARLAAAVRDLAGKGPAPLAWISSGDVDVARVLREAVTETAAASAFVFTAVAAVSAEASTAAGSTGSLGSSSVVGAVLRKLRKRGADAEAEVVALERLKAAEELMRELTETGISERVFRSLMNARVSLLNILTPSL
ncbi:uncharacterized protein LOC121987260 [Zingiber officinale]|uniref:Uncharacterized protein n=1 Tax=Zingiber officinale TaxID=94328 RepID=A0A8J5KXE5_ZINOF|nr:uncharacterized protein LOC121987260 [Zingiber officinale]KAG6502883.1 hypothetical protein ZIOFF_035172 [Zingiber officinale]